MKNKIHGIILFLLILSSCVKVEDPRQYIKSLFPIIAQKNAELVNYEEKNTARLRIISGIIKVHDDVNLDDMMADYGYLKKQDNNKYLSADENRSYITNRFMAASGRNDLPSWLTSFNKTNELYLYLR